MNKKVIIVAVLGLVGVGAILYFVFKKDDTTNTPSTNVGGAGTSGTPSNTGGQNTDPTLNTPVKDPNVKTLTEQEMQVITSLKDTILNDIRRKGTYKRSATRNAVQSEIDSNIQTLKSLGYALDLGNNLVKIDK
jgi:hypothetical protein